MIQSLAQMMVPSMDEVGKNIRLPVDGARKKKWEAFIANRKITQQAALYALMDWIVEQDELVQAMVLEQVPRTPDLAKFVIRHMGERYQQAARTAPNPDDYGKRTPKK